MLFKLGKVESPLCYSWKSEDKTHILFFYRCWKKPILLRHLLEIFNVGLDLASISPQSTTFGFVDDVLENKLLLNHILLIFEDYLFKPRKNKNLDINILKNKTLTKIRGLEANLEDNDKDNKKWTVISTCYVS